jgi:large subunit ribosomal protein L19
MDANILNIVEGDQKKKNLPNIEVGDTIEIKLIIRDDKGEKKRNQIYKGLVIAINGSGLRQTMTVRKISDGIGVEKIIPIHSPNIEEVTIIKKGKVRRSKLYYMRSRVGKKAMKVNESKRAIVIPQEESEPIVEEVMDENVEEDIEDKAKEVVEVKEETENEKKD